MHDIHAVNAANSHKVAGHPNRFKQWCLSIDELNDLN
jgi:hypothetical protein